MRKTRRKLSDDERKEFRPVAEASKETAPVDFGPSSSLIDSVLNPPAAAPAPATPVRQEEPERQGVRASSPAPERKVLELPNPRTEPAAPKKSTAKPLPEPEEAPPLPAPSMRQRPTAQVSWSVTPDYKFEIEQLIGNFYRASGTKIATAQWMRAFWDLMLEEEQRICRSLESVRGNPALRRPPNQDPVAQEEFADGLKDFLRAAFRRLPHKADPPKEVDE